MSVFVPRNAVETMKEFQWVISLSHPEMAEQQARDAIDVVGDVREIHGSRQLIVRAMSGYIINRNLTIEEMVTQYQFNEITLRGHFGGFQYVQSLSLGLQSFAMDMYDVSMLSGQGERLDAPVLLPVLDVQTVMVAP